MVHAAGLREVSYFRKPPADEFVGVLYGVFLPGREDIKQVAVSELAPLPVTIAMAAFGVAPVSTLLERSHVARPEIDLP